MYQNNRGESSLDNGGGSPYYFVSRRMLMINPVDINDNAGYADLM